MEVEEESLVLPRKREEEAGYELERCIQHESQPVGNHRSSYFGSQASGLLHDLLEWPGL